MGNIYIGNNSGKASEIKNAYVGVNGIAGAAGMLPSIFTLENGIDLALANKETIVMASHIVYELANKNNCKILPTNPAMLLFGLAFI